MNVIEELEKLKHLKNSDAISEPEFLKLKNEILKKHDEELNGHEKITNPLTNNTAQRIDDNENIGCVYSGLVVTLPMIFAWPVIFSNRYSLSNRVASALWLMLSIVLIYVIREAVNDPEVYAYSNNTSIAAASVDTKINKNEKTIEIGYPSGMYHIGYDIPEGEYVLTAKNGYFQVSKNSDGTFDGIICNDNFHNRSIVTVKMGQYLLLNGQRIIPYDSIKKPLYGENDIIPEGMYKVGDEIPIGRYKITAIGQAYYELTDNSKHYLLSIISNDVFDSQRYLTLRNGQYIKLRDAEMKIMPNKR